MNIEQQEAWLAEKVAALAKEFDLDVEMLWSEEKGAIHLSVLQIPDTIDDIVAARLQLLLDEVNSLQS